MILDLTGNEQEIKNCMGCEIISGELKPFGGILFKNENFIITQDFELPIDGFIIITSVRHISKYTELTESEQIDLTKIINKTLKMIEETQKVNLSNYYNISGSHFAGRRLAVYAEFKNKDGFYKTLKDKKHLYGLTFKDYILVLKLFLGPKISMFIYKMLHFKNIFK